MADIKSVILNETEYEINDAVARASIGDLDDLPTTEKSNLVDSIAELQATTAAMVGSPLVANTAEEMTDTNKIYVYVGSETGYTAGNWYYYDGSEWQSGGVYNAVAVETDTTLSVSGKAADAKATGDKITDLNDALDDLEEDLEQAIEDFAVPTQEAVDNWLDEHPEATTTVQDGSITKPKLASALKLEIEGDTASIFGKVSASDILDIQSGNELGDVVISEAGFYDYRGATCNSLTIAASSVHISNLTIKTKLTFSDDSQNCRLFRVNIITTDLETIVAGARTWGHSFVQCNFVYTGTGNAVWCKIQVDVGINKMDTLLLIGCYFYNYAEIFSLYNGANISVIGGYADSIKSYIKCHAYGNINAFFSGFDFESFDSIFDSTYGGFVKLSVDGYIASGSIINVVNPNLECAINLSLNINRNSNVKISSDDTAGSVALCCTNISDLNVCHYYRRSVVADYEYSRRIPAGVTIDLGLVHVQKITWSDNDFIVYVDGYQYTSGTTYGGTRHVMIKNNSASSKVFTATFNTKNILG